MGLVLALFLAFTFSAPPVIGGEASQSPALASAPSLKAAAAIRVAQADPARAVRRAQEQAATTTADSPSGFLSTPRGKFVVLLTAAALGFAVYSTQANDVKRAPQRQQE